MTMINYNINNNNKLKEYVNLLLQWQKKINLISNSSIPVLWQRHIADSLQLKEFINTNNNTILDLGSGAGFPGLVLAICDDSNNNYILIDSNSKKSAFLNTVKVQLDLKNVTILNDRIESLYHKTQADFLLARGLSNIDKLLEHSNYLLTSNGTAIFLKGQTLDQEIDNIKNKNLLTLFSFKVFHNKIDSNGKIIIINRKN